MSRKAALLITTALLVVLAWWIQALRQPTFQGKALSRWLRDFDFGGPRGAAARAAVREMGTNSLPTLVRYLAHHDTALQRRVLLFFQKHDVGIGFFEDDFQWHRRAALACGELGLGAEPALPALAEALTNSQAPEQVVEALSKMLPKSVWVLTNAVISCPSQIAQNRAITSLVDGCAYPEVAAICIAGISNALPQFLTGDAAIVALARLRDGNYSSQIHEAATRALKTAQPLPQYPESVNSLLDGKGLQIPSQLRGRYGLPETTEKRGLPVQGP